MIYEKATAEVILFDNSDVITASSCRSPGHDKGHGCANTSGDCPGQEWKENGNGLSEWRANRAGL